MDSLAIHYEGKNRFWCIHTWSEWQNCVYKTTNKEHRDELTKSSDSTRESVREWPQSFPDFFLGFSRLRFWKTITMFTSSLFNTATVIKWSPLLILHLLCVSWLWQKDSRHILCQHKSRLTCMLMRRSRSVLVMGRPPSCQWSFWIKLKSSAKSSWHLASSVHERVNVWGSDELIFWSTWIQKLSLAHWIF